MHEKDIVWGIMWVDFKLFHLTIIMYLNWPKFNSNYMFTLNFGTNSFFKILILFKKMKNIVEGRKLILHD
jgi:hypothetical protein